MLCIAVMRVGCLMPYSNCFSCKQEGHITRLDVPTQGHHKYCKSCLTGRKVDKLLKAIQEFSDFIKEL